MHLDEIGSMPQGVALAIYPLLNGRGKTRMTEFGGMRPQHSWRVFILSTGELSIHERIMQEPQRQAIAGELVRTPDIPVDNLPRDPDLTTEEAQELARTWKRVAAELYGTAGPAFVSYLLENFETLAELRQALLDAVDQAYADLCFELSKCRPLQAPHKRALRHFALVLAMLRWAADAVLPFSNEDVERAVFTVAEAWYTDFPILTEHERLLDSIRTYIKSHRANIVDTAMVQEHQVLGRQTPVLVRHDGKFWLSPEFFQSACGDLLAKRAAKLLDRLGVLHRHGGTDSNLKAKLTVWPRVFNGVRYYALLADKMFAESELAELTNSRPWPGRGSGRLQLDEEYDPPPDANDEFCSSGLERAPRDM